MPIQDLVFYGNMDKKGNWYNMGKLSDSVKETLPEFQDLLGHKNLQTTMIYTHVATKNILGVRSPLDK